MGKLPGTHLCIGTGPSDRDFPSVENISKKEHPHRDLSTALRSGRDDKGKGGASMEISLLNRNGFDSS